MSAAALHQPLEHTLCLAINKMHMPNHVLQTSVRKQQSEQPQQEYMV